MKRLQILILTMILTSCASAQTKVTSESFPTNFSISDFQNLKKLNGDIIAFDGTIKQEKLSRNNTPFYYLELGKEKGIWTTLMFKNDKNEI